MALVQSVWLFSCSEERSDKMELSWANPRLIDCNWKFRLFHGNYSMQLIMKSQNQPTILLWPYNLLPAAPLLQATPSYTRICQLTLTTSKYPQLPSAIPNYPKLSPATNTFQKKVCLKRQFFGWVGCLHDKYAVIIRVKCNIRNFPNVSKVNKFWFCSCLLKSCNLLVF